jgi:cytolysin-activating lysine-acyltransferase
MAKNKTPSNGKATAMPSEASETSASESAVESPELTPEVAAKISELRSTLRENFGKIVMAMMMVPRYRSQMLSDLQHLVLDPMLKDRVAIAYRNDAKDNPAIDMEGFAFWASVSEEVDGRIREQIASGTFPIRLKPEDWNSGNINWLLDVIAPNQSTIATVIANFRKVVKEGDLRLHPLISRLVNPETLEKMGARKSPDAEPEAATVN